MTDETLMSAEVAEIPAADFLERYRTKEEIAQWRADDPIAAFAAVLHDREEVTQEQLNAVQDEVRTEIREAVRFGTQGEEPTVEAMMAGIYAPSPVDPRPLEARA